MDAEHPDFDPAEFAEFLDADGETFPADDAFRERLRSDLWSMVRSQAERRGPPGKPVSPIDDRDRRR